MKHALTINGVTIEAVGPSAPILRARRADDSRDAITHEAVPGHVLACGGCDAAIEGWRGTTDMRPQPWVGHLYAVPCGCEVRDVPVWARAQKKEAKRNG